MTIIIFIEEVPLIDLILAHFCVIPQWIHGKTNDDDDDDDETMMMIAVLLHSFNSFR